MITCDLESRTITINGRQVPFRLTKRPGWNYLHSWEVTFDGDVDPEGNAEHAVRHAIALDRTAARACVELPDSAWGDGMDADTLVALHAAREDTTVWWSETYLEDYIEAVRRRLPDFVAARSGPRLLLWGARLLWWTSLGGGQQGLTIPDPIPPRRGDTVTTSTSPHNEETVHIPIERGKLFHSYNGLRLPDSPAYLTIQEQEGIGQIEQMGGVTAVRIRHTYLTTEAG